MTDKVASAVDSNLLEVMTEDQKFKYIISRFRCKRDLYDYLKTNCKTFFTSIILFLF